MNYLLILVSICLSAFSQISLRYGMTRPQVAEALAGDTGPIGVGLAILKSPFVMIGLFAFGLSAVLWLFVLSKIPVSFAYPFVSLGIVLTTGTGVLLLHESISPTSAIGIAVIVCGIVLVAIGRG